MRKLLPNASGFCGSLSTKFGDSEKVVETFEVLRSFEESAAEMTCSQMRHCYGSACNLLVARFQPKCLVLVLSCICLRMTFLT